MKLSIKPVQEHRNRVFTSADVVVGVIYLDVNDSITISRIQFSLKARLRSSEVSPVQYEYARRPGFITLFETSRVLLFPERPLCKSTRYTLGKGRHEYQFGVDLSLLSRYASAELLLDPSIYAARRWETGRISYTICVTVQGCGLLRRQIRESMYLTSVSLDPPGFPPFPPSHDLSGLTCQVIPLCAFGLQSEPRRDDGSAPPYSSAIVLRAGISSGDGQLRAGDPLPLRFWITVPLAARRQLKAYLKSIRLFLIDPAVVTVGGRRVVDLVGIAIREVRLEIALDAVTKNETIEVDPTLWKDCRVPPSAAESTSLHEVDRKYLLQILCEFSYDETSSSKLATVLVPVAIATAGAPPGYRAVADKCQYCAGEGDLPRYEVSPIAGGEHFADGHSNMQDAWQEILR